MQLALCESDLEEQFHLCFHVLFKDALVNAEADNKLVTRFESSTTLI